VYQTKSNYPAHSHIESIFFSYTKIYRKIFCATLTGKGFYSVSPLQTNVAKGCTELSEINPVSWVYPRKANTGPRFLKIRKIFHITKYCPNSTWIRVALNII